jgi:hypothetical protein
MAFGREPPDRRAQPWEVKLAGKREVQPRHRLDPALELIGDFHDVERIEHGVQGRDVRRDGGRHAVLLQPRGGGVEARALGRGENRGEERGHLLRTGTPMINRAGQIGEVRAVAQEP